MNYYNVLGLKNTASQEEIKSAYKKLVKKYHPDIYKGDKSFAEKKTAEINVAYDVLSNPKTKQEYDSQYTTNYSYTPPQYDYNNSYKNNTYQKSYTNYSNANNGNYYSYYKTYTNTKDGSEHDYTTYANYERKYSNFHRSQTPNSNYTYTDNFSKKVESTIDSFSSNTKIRLFFLIIFLCLFYLLNSLSSLLNTVKKDSYYDYSKTNNSISHSQSTPFTSYGNYFSENTTSSNDFVYEDSILSDYFTESELHTLYNQYIKSINSENKTNLYITYDEYLKILESYFLEYTNKTSSSTNHSF